MIKPISTSDQVRITNHVLGTSFRNWKELNTHIQGVREVLKEYWYRTYNLDVYSDPGYPYEALNSFGKSTECVDTLCRYFLNDWGNRVVGSDTGLVPGVNRSRNFVTETFTGDVSKMTALDVWSGNGLTSITLALNGFGSVETVGSSPGQLEYQRGAELLMLGHELPNHLDIPIGTWDVVCSFEVLEHYKEPIPHLRELMSLVKRGGYLCESRGFSATPNVGHYLEYIHDGETVSYQTMTRRITKVLETEFVMIADCFRKPKIWRKL